jgi:hypothetical protein
MSSQRLDPLKARKIDFANSTQQGTGLDFSIAI